MKLVLHIFRDKKKLGTFHYPSGKFTTSSTNVRGLLESAVTIGIEEFGGPAPKQKGSVVDTVVFRQLTDPPPIFLLAFVNLLDRSGYYLSVPALKKIRKLLAAS